MHVFLWPLMALSATGLVLSFSLHLAAWTGHMPGLLQPLAREHAQLLIGGMFAAWVPAVLIDQRISTRKPAAYLTREAWLQGVPFYVDERAIVPRSFIAELLADGSIDPWLDEASRDVLDLCTGNGSLAVLAAMAYPEVQVTGADISPDALAVARINVDRHGLQDRVRLVESDGLAACPGPWDLILCNPPYVNAASMAALPAEYRAEPVLALAGGDDGMDLVRRILEAAPNFLSPEGVLVLEIGNEYDNFVAAFPELEPIWLSTETAEDQILLLSREQLAL